MRTPRFRARQAPVERTHPTPEGPLCAWISDDILLLAGSGRAGEVPSAGFSPALRFAPDEAVPAGNAPAIYVARVSPPASELPGVLTDLAALLRERVALWSPTARRGLLDFLASLGGELGLSPSLGEGLHQAREALRERHPLSVADRRLEREVSVHHLYRLDDHRFYIRGSIRASGTSPASLTVVSPEGESVELGGRPFLIRQEHNASPETGITGADFICRFETLAPSRRREGWTIELADSDGGVEVAAGLTPGGATESRDAIAADALLDVPERDTLLAEHVRPALSWLQILAHDSVSVAVDERFGEALAGARASIIVPLGERLDMIEHQLAAFADDPELRECELLYVLASPEQSERAMALARDLNALYRLPFRLLTPTAACGHALALELAASAASSSLLLLLDPQVIPARRGWVGGLARLYEATPRIGALTPKLLYQDEAIAHAGFGLEREAAGSEWKERAYFQGLHRDFTAANVARPVPAISLACGMIDAELFAAVGGMEWLYLGGCFAGSDLCLRLAEAGRENWYLPSVELYHLDDSQPPATPTGERAYDAWLHTRLRGEAAERAAAGHRGLTAVA